MAADELLATSGVTGVGIEELGESILAAVVGGGATRA
jgi:hypothetical protein